MDHINDFQQKYARVIIAVAVIFCGFILIFQGDNNFFNPSFLSDDGRIYFGGAYRAGWVEALFLPHNGYWNLYTNLFSTIAAHAFPIDYAPYVMEAGSFLLWGLLFIFIASPASPFISPLAKAAAVLISLFAYSPVTMVPVCNSHFYMGALAALILVSTPATRRAKALYAAMLGVCGLTGAVSLFLLPAYALAYRQERTRWRLIQLLVLCVCASIELAVFIYSIKYDASHVGIGRPGRGRFSTWERIDILMAWLANNALVHPFFTERYFHELGQSMAHTLIYQDDGYACVVAACTFGMVLLLLLMWGAGRPVASMRKSRPARLLTLCFVLFGVCTYITAYDMRSAEKTGLIFDDSRYFITPSIIIGWALLLHACDAGTHLARIAYGALLAGVVAIGMGSAFMVHYYPPKRIDFLDWHQELANWRSSPDARLVYYGGGVFKRAIILGPPPE